MKIKNPTLKTIIEHVEHFIKKCNLNNIPALSGQSAFFILLSIVPLILFVFAIYSILTGKSSDSISLPDVSLINGDEFRYLRILVQYVEDSIRSSGSDTVIITAVVTLWSAGRGAYCATEGIARIYQIPNKRFWLFKRIFAMGYTVVLMLMMLVCVLVMVVNFIVTGLFTRVLNLSWLRWPLIFLSYLLLGGLIMLLMALAVKLFLRKKIKNKRYYSMRSLLPGMALIVIAWNAVTIGVMLYIRYFSTSSLYGSLGTLFILMLWVYMMMFILLLGVQLNYIYRGEFSRKGWIKRMREGLKKIRQAEKNERTENSKQTEKNDNQE